MIEIFVYSKTSGSHFYPPFWNKKDLLQSLNKINWIEVKKDEVIKVFTEMNNLHDHDQEFLDLLYGKRFLAKKVASNMTEAIKMRRECEEMYLHNYKKSDYQFFFKIDGRWINK